MFQGAHTAIVTPFNADGSVDYGQLKANVEFQIVGGIDGVVPVGTTGESPTLTHDEHNQVIAAVVEAAAGKVKVIAGTGSNSTAEALAMTKAAAAAGADGTLQVNPYYNKPSQEGLYQHFATVADQGGLPVVLYNIPGRSAVALAADTVIRLAANSQVVAIKEATGSLDMASEVALATDLTILSGDDSLTLPIMSVGGHGVISVLSNIVPDRVKTLVDTAASGDFTKAQALHLNLFKLCKALLTIDTNPVPIKAAMAKMGMDTGTLRLPMTALAADKSAALDAILSDAGVGAAAHA